MPTARPRPSLPDACVAEALAIIAEVGLEGLSLREVARRLGVSHQAPYKHFPSRDHLLAEVVARTFADFATHLDSRPSHDDPAQDLAGMGYAYLDYASRHRLEYRLMFGTPLPDPQQHPGMLATARHAFSLLQDGLRRLRAARGQHADPERIDRDALFVWSALHGAASVMQASALATLAVGPDLIADMPRTVLERVGCVLAQP